MWRRCWIHSTGRDRSANAHHAAPAHQADRTPMKVILNANLGKAQLERRFANQSVHQGVWVGDADAAIAELHSANVLICPDHFFSAKLADAVRTGAPELRLIQLLTAGYD